MDNSSRSLSIRRIASSLLEKYHINGRNEIDILSLISGLDLNVSYRFADLKGLAGFSCYDRSLNRYGIFFDISVHNIYPTRTKFTAAHELGHIILGHFQIIYNNSNFFGNRILEAEADLFADELLMPTQPIIDLQMNAMDIISIYRVSACVFR